MIATIKKKRPKISAILGQTSKDAESALLGNGKKINFQNSELESITAESALMPKSQEMKSQNPHLEKLNGKSALSFTQKLNAMIAAGVSFDVGPDSFQAFGASNREQLALDSNRKEFLCTT